ncbi:hypothetical protein IPA_00175 [Ignicoccus pacificus DSM 13166]|uniref:Uncharacterized protein n=1 Tax=Ignicoccus pacificus DSM 13166 TaxID=940294 RepID=A0A977KAA6_9CREN|nr:hypothetical protein IPA_00175 [Ignicoccus pacificus DSM 13166]
MGGTGDRTMMLKQKHLKMLEMLREKPLDINEFITGEYEEREDAILTLLSLELQGFVKPVDPKDPRVFTLTDAGKVVYDVWEALGKPKTDPWFDSAIHMMLWTLWKTGGAAPKDWVTPLKERGFLTEENKLNEEAKKLVEVFEPGKRERKIRVTRDLGAILARIPVGPASATTISKYPEDMLELLEAMGVLVYSAPDRGYYALTRLGRYLKEAIRELKPVAMEYVLVNKRIMDLVKKLIEGEELTEDEKLYLLNLGYLEGDRPSRAARLLYLAMKELERKEWWATFTVGLTRVDQWVMRVIDHLWKKAENNPELKPTKKLIQYWIERHRDEIGMDEETYKELEFSDYTIGIALYRLEALELVKSYEEKEKMIYELTDYGKRLLEVIKKGKVEEIPSYAVRPLIYADRGLPPFRLWIEEAIKWNLMGPGGAGTKAKELMRIARRVKRMPLLTKFEVLVLQKMLPSKQTEPVEELLKRFDDPEKARAALYWLELWGAVEFHGNGHVELTEIGEMLKHALVAVPPGVATPVHPHFLRVLQVIKELGNYEDIREIVNRTRLTLGIVKDAIVVAREAKLLGRKDLTGEGELLLKAVEEIQKHVEEWA